MQEKNIDLRDRFKEIRKEKKIPGLLTEIQVADALGMKQNNFNKQLKTGTNLSLFRKICDLFEIKMEDLFPAKQTKIENSNLVSEPSSEYQKTPLSNQTQLDIMSELQFYKEQNQLLKENNTMQKEKILRLEAELKACQESNRVHPL